MQVAHKSSGNQSVLKMLQQVYSISRHTHTDNRTIQFLHIDIEKHSHVTKTQNYSGGVWTVRPPFCVFSWKVRQENKDEHKNICRTSQLLD